jgi:hypothetical protein
MLTTKQKDKIIQLYKEGNPINTIHRITGYYRPTIKKVLETKGLYTNPKVRTTKPHIYINNKYNINKNIKDIKTEDINVNVEDKETEDINTGHKEGIKESKELEICKAEIVQKENNKLLPMQSQDHVLPQSSQQATTPEHRQIQKIDKILNKLLKQMDSLEKIEKATFNQAAVGVAILVDKKKTLKELTPEGNKINQVIFNFINNRDFISELKEMQKLKEIPQTIKTTD